MVYTTTASFTDDKFTRESMITPVPLVVLPVAEPALTDDTQEYTLPGMDEAGVKLKDVFEQMDCVEFVPVLFG